MKAKQYLVTVLFSLLLLVVVFFVGRCSTKPERQQQIENLVAARDSISSFSVVIGDLRNTVYEKNAIILTKDDAIRSKVLENERLKALHIKDLITNTELSGEVKRLKDSLSLPSEVVFVTVKDTSGNHLAIKLPYEWKYLDQYTSLTTGVRLNKTAYFDLSVPFSGTVSVGYVKSGFLKTSPRGIFTTENPYLKVNQMDVLIVEEKKTVFQKTWFHVLVGGIIFETVHQVIKK